MFNMNIFYIHGFNSGPSSTSGRKFKEIFNDSNVNILSFDSKAPFESNFIKLIKDIKDFNLEEYIITGISLGGFYANELANYFNCSVAMFNPAYKPHIQLKKFIGPNVSFENGEKWNLTDEIVESYNISREPRKYSISKLIFIGRNDSIINPEKSFEYWKDYGKVLLTDDEHSVADFSPYKNEIKTLYGTING